MVLDIPRLQGIPTTIVEQHGDALRYWPLANAAVPVAASGFAEAFTLLHVDSHSDIMEIIDDDAETGWAPLLRRFAPNLELSAARSARGSWRKAAQKLVQIGDYITAAIWAGLVDEMVWLRSDFPTDDTVVYNGPAPGKYLVELDWSLRADAGRSQGLPATGQLVCFRVLRRWFSFSEQVRGNSETSEFSTCDLSAAHAVSPRRFNLTVATSHQLLHNFGAIGEAGQGLVEDPARRWILDVDLDFFASYDPAYERFMARGLSERAARIVGDLLRTNGTCSEGARRMGGSQLSILRGLAGAVGTLPLHLRRDGGRAAAQRRAARFVTETLQAFSPLTATCNLGAGRSEALYHFLSSLPGSQQLAWRRVFDPRIADVIGEDFSQSIFQNSPGPHFADRSDALRSLELFGRILNATASPEGSARALLNLGLGTPVAITVARSMHFDRYLPRHLWPLIEGGVLHSLQAAFGHLEVRYHGALEAVR